MYYDRIDVSEGTDPTKSNKSRECMICQSWLFNHSNFKIMYVMIVMILQCCVLI